MPRRYFNWKLAIVLVIGFSVFSATAVGLRRWHRDRRAEQGLQAGIEAYDQKQWEKATKDLGRYLAVERNDVPILLKYADAQLKTRPTRPGNIQQAIAAYGTVLRIDKTHCEAAKKLAEIYLAIGMPGEAELIADRHLQTNDDPEIRRLLALALAGQRKFGEAAAQLKAILQEYPELILAYETLGQLAEQRPQDYPEPAAHWFNQAVQNNPSSALAYISRAGFYLRSKDKTKALADLQQAEQLDLSDPNVQLRLAQEFIGTNILDKAEEHLAAVQKTMPADEKLWQTWAQLAIRSQSQEKMVNVAETGLKELSCQPWEFMPQAIELFIRAGKLDQAASCITKLRQKDIFPEAAAFFEGLVADQRGQLFEAVKCWRRAVELGNKSAQVRLSLASALLRLGDTQSAQQQLRTLISEKPNSIDGHLALVRLLAQTGNWDNAAEYARRAMELSPDNLEAALAYLQAQIRLLPALPSGQISQKQQDQDIERRLAALEKNIDIAAEVKLLRFQMAMQQNNFAKASALVEDLKKAPPSPVKVALAEADLLIAQKNEDEAILILNKAIEEAPDAVEPVKYLAFLLDRQDNYEKSEEVIKDALARIKQPAEQRDLGLLLADLYSRWKQDNNAYKLLETLAQKLPNDIPVKRRLLARQEVTNNTDQAQQLINDIKSFEGENGWQWRYEQARIWFAGQDFKKRYPQIILLLQENLLANPDDQASRMLLATAYERAGQLQLAISTYREALGRSPEDLRIIIPTVAALYRAKEYEQAEEILSRASRQNQYDPQLQRLQLQSHLRRGQLSSASDILQDILNNDPNNQAVCLSLALVKMRQNKLDEAGELLAELKAHDPNSLTVAYTQIQLHIRQGKTEEALKICNEIVNNLNNAAAYILRARTYNTLNQASKAMEDLEHAAAIEPNNNDVWMAKSEFYRAINRLDLAIADIQHALSLAPDNIQIQKRAIALLLAADDKDKVYQGRAILDKALKSNPEDMELTLFKARLLLAEGTAPAVENAERLLQKITEDRPEIGEAWSLRGEILLAQGQPGKAIDIILRGLVNNPNNKTLLLLKARAEAARSPILAIPTLNVVRQQDPNDVDIAMLLANTYITADEPEKAVELLKKQLSSCKDSNQERKVNIALAVALYHSGSKSDAQKKFDSLLQSLPDDPSPLLSHARLLRDDKLFSQLNQKVNEWSQSHPQDTNTLVAIATDLAAAKDNQAQKTAEDILRRILSLDPDNLPAMNTLAMLLQMMGRSNESAELYQRVLKHAPDNVIAINNLAWIMCEEQGKHQDALELAQKGLKMAPQYIDLIDTRGVAYYRLGEFNKAVQDFTECIKLYPTGNPAAAVSRFHLARAFAKLGQTNNAVEHLLYALDLENRIGGLSTEDLTEAQHLLEQLQGGS